MKFCRLHALVRILTCQIGHEIRSGTTLRAKAVCSLSGRCRWVVTGTPIQNRWQDLASQLKFLQFRPDQDLKSLSALLANSGPDSDVKRLLRLMCLRRPKRTVQLPQRIDEIHEVRLSVHEKLEYDFVRHDLLRLLDNDGTSPRLTAYSNALSKISNLRQICNLGNLYQRRDQNTGGQKDLLQPSNRLQMLYDGLVSVGEAQCVKCGDDLSNQGDYRSSTHDDFGNAPPRMSLCGALLCATCHDQTLEDAPHVPICGHEPPCLSSFVNEGPNTHDLPISVKDSLPSKIQALRQDVVAIPDRDKLYVTS